MGYCQPQKDYHDCSWVCHLRGKRLKTIKGSWQTGWVKAGLGRFRNPDTQYVGTRASEGALIHDFRRTAVINMEESGLPRMVAMAISGHKTDSIYRRYHIVRREHLIDAGKRLLAHHQAQHASQPGGHSVDT